MTEEQKYPRTGLVDMTVQEEREVRLVRTNELLTAEIVRLHKELEKK